MHKRVKILFIILLVIAVAVVGYVVIRAVREKMIVSAPVTTAPEIKTDIFSKRERERSGTSENMLRQLTPEEISAYENAAKQAESIQQKTAIGSLSAEEARDQLREIGSKIPVPPPPPAMKK